MCGLAVVGTGWMGVDMNIGFGGVLTFDHCIKGLLARERPLGQEAGSFQYDGSAGRPHESDQWVGRKKAGGSKFPDP